jgi:hypothetical protein
LIRALSFYPLLPGLGKREAHHERLFAGIDPLSATSAEACSVLIESEPGAVLLF